MSRTVVFETPGKIPVESFTVMGLNAKPNSENPIGFFGTGLKMAIAILTREGLKVTIHIGRDQYMFYTQDKVFRGRPYKQIRMKLTQYNWSDGPKMWLKPKYTDLPFTTELARNWELWQAFRELESNTRDEKGETQVWAAPETWKQYSKDGHSYIIVEGDKFAQEYDEREKTFLPELIPIKWQNEKLMILNRPSQYLYWRGIRVMDLPKPSKFTYNILTHVDLTEDRTVKYEFLVTSLIAECVVSDIQDEALIKLICKVDPTHWESTVQFNYVYTTSSPAFVSTLKSEPRTYWTQPSYGHYETYNAPTIKVDPFAKWPRPWSVDQVLCAIQDAKGVWILTPKTVGPETVELLVAIANKVNDGEDPIKVMKVDKEEIPY